jgi:FKBP-type peptidyl-prolyl cis-trans isomerase
MTKRALLTCAAAVLAIALAACGGSQASGVQLAPGQGASQAVVPTTPTPPPALSAKPVVKVPKSCATKQLLTNDLVKGTGQVVQAGQTVTVNYVGVLCKTGVEFDSSWKRNQPFTTALTAGGVIRGWVQGIPGMRVGGRRELIIPAALAYGKAGSPPTIPPNSPLVFVVDLLSVA